MYYDVKEQQQNGIFGTGINVFAVQVPDFLTTFCGNISEVKKRTKHKKTTHTTRTSVLVKITVTISVKLYTLFKLDEKRNIDQISDMK